MFLKGNPLICKPIRVSYLRNRPYTTKDNGIIRLFENIYGLIFIYLIITENEMGDYFSRNGSLRGNKFRARERKERNGVIEF